MRYTEWDEDLLATVALRTTVAFFLYTPLVFLSILLILEILPLVCSPSFCSFYFDLSQKSQNLISYTLIGLGEVVLFYLVFRGWLPGTKLEWVLPFSETQLGWGVAVLSVIPWVLSYDLVRFEIFHATLNGSLLIGVLVFFITKSILSREIRWEVLRILVVPYLQILLVSEFAVHEWFSSFLGD